MIGKVFEKKSVKALFKYVNKSDARYIGGNLSMENETDFLNNFSMYQGTKKISKPALHFILSSPKSDKPIDDEEWLIAVQTYLKEMNIDPDSHGWSAVLHQDTKNPHVHVICSKTNLDGQVWNNSFSKYRSLKATAKVEEVLDLWNKQSTNQIQKNKDNKLNPFSLKPSPDSIYHVKKRNDNEDFFKEIQNKANEVVAQNRNITLSQFKALLKQNDVDLEVMTDSKNETVKGLVFSKIDPSTNEKHSFKASSLGSKFLWKNLSSKMGYTSDLNSNAATVLEQDNQNQKSKITFSTTRP